MANEKITLELVTKLVDAGFKQAIKEINRVQKVEQRRAKKNRQFAKAYIKDLNKRNEKLKRITENEEKSEAKAKRKTLAIALKMSRTIIQRRKQQEKELLRIQKNAEQKKRQEIRKTQRVMKGVGASVTRGFLGIDRGVSALQSMAMWAGIAGTALTAAFVKVASVGANFEQSITNVGAIANLSVQEMDRLSVKARELGAATAYTATQVANGMTDLARAGLSADKITGAIAPTLYLAGAAGADMSQATKLMARTMAQFNLEAKDAAAVADTFTLAMQNSLLDIESLDSSMRYAGAGAGAFGWDIQQTTAAVALFMDQTGMGSTAGTQFRHVLLSLAGPTKAAQQVMKDLAKQQGVSYKVIREKLNPATSDFETILKTLKPVMKDHDKILKLVNKRSSGSLQKILKDYHEGRSKFTELTTLFAEGAGAASQTYDMQMETVLGKTKIVQSKLQESFLQLFSAMSGPLKKFLDSMMIMMDEVILVFKAAGPALNIMFAQAFGEAGDAASATGEKIGIMMVKVVNAIIKIIKNLPKILKLIGNAFKTILKIWLYVKGFFIIAGLTKVIHGITVAVVALGAAFKAATIKARILYLTMGGIVGAGLAIGSMFLFDEAGAAFDSLGDGMADLMDAGEASEKVLKAQTQALREAKDSYESLLEKQGAGAKAGESTAAIRKTSARMLESTTDENIRSSLLSSMGLGEEGVSEAIETGQLVDILDTVIPEKTRKTIQEMAKQNDNFHVSLQTLMAVSKKLGKEEADSFVQNLNRKALELQRFREKTEQIAKMTEAPADYVAPLGAMHPDIDSPEVRVQKSELKGIEAGTAVGLNEDAIRKSLEQAEKAKNLSLSGAVLAEQIIANRDYMNEILAKDSAEGSIMNMGPPVGEVVEKLAKASSESVAYGKKLSFTNDEIKAVTDALIKLEEEQGGFSNSSLEVAAALSKLSGATEEDVSSKSKFIEQQFNTLSQGTVQIKKDVQEAVTGLEDLDDIDLGSGIPLMRNLVEDVMETGGKSATQALLMPGFAEEFDKAHNHLIKSTRDAQGNLLKEAEMTLEEYMELESDYLKNMSKEEVLSKAKLFDADGKLIKDYAQQINLVMYRAHVDPLAKAYQYMQETDMPTDAAERYKKAIQTMIGEIAAAGGNPFLEFGEAAGFDAEGRALVGEMSRADFTGITRLNDQGQAENRKFSQEMVDRGKRATDQIVSYQNTITDNTVKNLEKIQRDREERNKRYRDNLKSFYKKLEDMEKKQAERLAKVQEDETDKYANELKRRVKKTKEFFKEGYKLVKNNAKKTRDLQRREAILVAQIREEEAAKARKRMDKDAISAQDKVDALTLSDRDKLLKEMARDEKEANIARIRDLQVLSKANTREIGNILNAFAELDKGAPRGKAGKLQRFFADLGQQNVKYTEGILSVQRTSLDDIDEKNITEQVVKDFEEKNKKISSEVATEMKMRQSHLAGIKAYLDVLAHHLKTEKQLFGTETDKSQYFGYDPETDTMVNQVAGAKAVLESEDYFGKALESVSQAALQAQYDSLTNMLALMQDAYTDYNKNILATEEQFNKDRIQAEKTYQLKVSAGRIKLAQFEEKAIKDRLIQGEREFSNTIRAIRGEQFDNELEDYKKQLNKEGLLQATQLKLYQDFLRKRLAAGHVAAQELLGMGMDLKSMQFLFPGDAISDPGAEYGKKAMTAMKRANASIFFRKTFKAQSQHYKEMASLLREHEAQKLNIQKTFQTESIEEDKKEKESKIDELEKLSRKLELYNSIVEKADRAHSDASKTPFLELDVDATNLRIKELKEEINLLDIKNEGQEEGLRILKALGAEQNIQIKDAKKEGKELELTMAAAATGTFNFLMGGFAYLQQALDYAKRTLDFFTGGNLKLNPFELMSEAAGKLIEQMEEIKEKRRELDEQFQAGRISSEEHRANREKLDMEKQNARAIAKETIDTMVNDSIRFMEALVDVAPMIIKRLEQKLPQLLAALERLMPTFVRILDEMMPVFIKIAEAMAVAFGKVAGAMLGGAMKTTTGGAGIGGTLGAIVGTLIPGVGPVLGSLIGGTLGAATGKLISSFNDTPGPMMVSGYRSFNDTPGPVNVSPLTKTGMLARFAPGDTFIAAKEPQELMRQALMAVGSEVKMGTRRPPPPPSSASQSMGGGSRIDIAVIAEGRVLDAVQMQALERGHAPKIAKRLRKASGVKVGFNRGRYNKFAVNES